MIDQEHSYRRQLREKAAQHGLSVTQLNAICQVTAGAPLSKLTPERARFALNAIISKGDSVVEWAQELERSL